jgi:hypothetical protein
MAQMVQIAAMVIMMVAAPPTFIIGLAINERRLRADPAS